MYVTRQSVAEVVEEERGLVAEDALTLRPKPEDHEVLLVARREVGQPVEPASGPGDPALAQMVLEELARVARPRRLVKREMALLLSGDLVELVPVGRVRSRGRVVCRHVKYGFTFLRGGGGDLRTRTARRDAPLFWSVDGASTGRPRLIDAHSSFRAFDGLANFDFCGDCRKVSVSNGWCLMSSIVPLRVEWRYDIYEE